MCQQHEVADIVVEQTSMERLATVEATPEPARVAAAWRRSLALRLRALSDRIAPEAVPAISVKQLDSCLC